MMFYKYFMVVFVISSLLLAEEIGLEYEGIAVKTMDAQGNNLYTVVKREIPEACKKVPLSNTMLWTGNYAHPNVPEACKSTFVHTIGSHIYPMYLDTDITTYGELEVLAFIKQMQTDDSLLLIDVCKEEFYKYRTIPGAVNMPFNHFKERTSYVFEFEQHMKDLGVTVNEEDDSLDFTHAKTITVFCNGPWCSLSVTAILALLEIGYPAEKINWYRGGMQQWLAAGLTSTRK
jgi:rhodanese-related sulfurtransferase